MQALVSLDQGMNILLTGGTGYIGSHTAVALAQSGHHVVLLDNLANSEAAVADRVSRIVGRAVPFVQGDVRDTALVRDALTSHAIDAVIHFAGLKAVGESVEKPIDYYANNVQGTISLLQAMQITSVRTLVFSSSATVYGNSASQGLPLDETSPVSAVNPYGRTKLQVEELLRDLAQSDAAWRIACLRYFNPAGAHESALIGESPRGIPNNLMPFVVRVAAGLSPQLNVFGNDYPTPDGTGIRDYIHVMDLADGHVAALGYLAHHPGWSAINLGTGRGYSVLDVIRAFERASGCAIAHTIAPRRPGDVATCYANPSKANAALQWRAVRSLDDMCASAWRYYQNQAERA
jgi:UDP-glucose 4-epimerase